MNIQDYVEKMKKAQKMILDFIDNEANEEENYENLIQYFNDIKIIENKHDLKTILYILSYISSYHYRNGHFFNKIEKILTIYKNDIKKYYSEHELFKIFLINKRILLFFIENKFINFDQNMYLKMMSFNYPFFQYPEYFAFEIKPFIEKEIKDMTNNNDYYDEKVMHRKEIYEKIKEITKENYEKFNEKRKIGENDSCLCKIIQNDLIEQFIIYVNKENYSLSNYIERSLFETHIFLLQRPKVSLIEYAAFFGSIQIFRYLYKNGVNLNPSLWIYAVQSDNSEQIYLLEENEVFLNKNKNRLLSTKWSYLDCFLEAIKCHHIDVSNYILDNYLQTDKSGKLFNEEYESDVFSSCFWYHNFFYFPDDIINQKSNFLFACEFDYYTIVEFFLTSCKININEIRIVKRKL